MADPNGGAKHVPAASQDAQGQCAGVSQGSVHSPPEQTGRRWRPRRSGGASRRSSVVDLRQSQAESRSPWRRGELRPLPDGSYSDEYSEKLENSRSTQARMTSNKSDNAVAGRKFGIFLRRRRAAA